MANSSPVRDQTRQFEPSMVKPPIRLKVGLDIGTTQMYCTTNLDNHGPVDYTQWPGYDNMPSQNGPGFRLSALYYPKGQVRPNFWYLHARNFDDDPDFDENRRIEFWKIAADPSAKSGMVYKKLCSQALEIFGIPDPIRFIRDGVQLICNTMFDPRAHTSFYKTVPELRPEEILITLAKPSGWPLISYLPFLQPFEAFGLKEQVRISAETDGAAVSSLSIAKAQENDLWVLCDIGGATIDIDALEVKQFDGRDSDSMVLDPLKSLEETMHLPRSLSNGCETHQEVFQNIITERLKDHGYSDEYVKHTADLMARKFRSKKDEVYTHELKDPLIELPSGERQIIKYRDWSIESYKGKEFVPVYASVVSPQEQMTKLMRHRSELRGSMDPSIKAITSTIREIYECVSIQNRRKMKVMMVGGGSNCVYIYKSVETYCNEKFKIPVYMGYEPKPCVAHGIIQRTGSRSLELHTRSYGIPCILNWYGNRGDAEKILARFPDARWQRGKSGPYVHTIQWLTRKGNRPIRSDQWNWREEVIKSVNDLHFHEILIIYDGDPLHSWTPFHKDDLSGKYEKVKLTTDLRDIWNSKDFRMLLPSVPKHLKRRGDSSSRYLPHCYSVENHDNITEVFITIELKDKSLRKFKVQCEPFTMNSSTIHAHPSIFRNTAVHDAPIDDETAEAEVGAPDSDIDSTCGIHATSSPDPQYCSHAALTLSGDQNENEGSLGVSDDEPQTGSGSKQLLGVHPPNKSASQLTPHSISRGPQSLATTMPKRKWNGNHHQISARMSLTSRNANAGLTPIEGPQKAAAEPGLLRPSKARRRSRK